MKCFLLILFFIKCSLIYGQQGSDKEPVSYPYVEEFNTIGIPENLDVTREIIESIYKSLIFI